MKVSPGLEPLLIDIDSVTPDPNNARAHNERNLAAIADSLRLFGQQKPIVIDSDGIVLAGNGTVDALRRLGWKQVAAVRIDLPKKEAIAFAIADNRTAELATWDREELARQLEDIRAEFQDMEVEALGFNEKEMDALVNAWGDELETIDPDTLPTYKESQERCVVRVDDVASEHMELVEEIAREVLADLELTYDIAIH